MAGVITQPDRPRGRGQKTSDGPVKALALSAGLPVFQPERLSREAFEEDLRSLNADIGVVAAYGKILPDWLLAALPRGLINVHASLLPRYRGASPIHRAVIAGDRETGVTIMRVVKALDAGPMIASGKVPIGPDDTTTNVESILAIRGARVTASRPSMPSRPVTPRKLPRMTHWPPTPRSSRKPKRTVDWTKPAPDVHNLIRGLWPWPHAHTFLDRTRYILHRSRLSNADAGTARPGTIIKASASDGLHVACGGSTAIELLDLQLEGKRVLSARDAMAAKTLIPGARFSSP